MIRVARGALLLATAVMIVKLLVTGQLHYYLTPSFDWLSVLTALALAVLGAAELRGANGTDRAVELDALVTLGLLAVPVVVGFTLTPHALGIAGLGGAPVSRLAVAYPDVPDASASSASRTTAAPPGKPIADVADALSYIRSAGQAGVGQHIHARGLLARSQDLPANEFVLVRYTIVHCVADAQPIGLLVQFDGALPPEDHWVEVDGTLASESVADVPRIAIQAQQLLSSSEPTDPYIVTF